MKLHFTKMHGAGNDFVVIDAISQDIDFTPAQWKRWATAASASAPTRSSWWKSRAARLRFPLPHL
jgi:hypothetical protein